MSSYKSKKPKRISLKNFNPEDPDEHINSPRSLEALEKLGILAEELYSKNYNDLLRENDTVREAKCL